MHSSSMGSGNTLMNQELIDLVDNLIDSSPKTRGEIYDKGQFNLKIMRTKEDNTDFATAMSNQKLPVTASAQDSESQSVQNKLGE